MGKFNRTTLKQRISDFINRIAPFDGNPLIQKLEDQEIRNDVADSVILKTADSVTFNPTNQNVVLDFTNSDEVKLVTTGSIQTIFNITVQGLETSQNQIGRIIVSKKTGDVINFSNANVFPFESPNSQIGKSFVSFAIIFVSPNYRAMYLESNDFSSSIDLDSENSIATSRAVFLLNQDTQNKINTVTNNFQNGDSNLLDLLSNPTSVGSIVPINAGNNVFTSNSFQTPNALTIRKYIDGFVRITGLLTMSQSHDFNGTEYLFMSDGFVADRNLIFTLGVFKQGDNDSADQNVNMRIEGRAIRIESNGTVSSGRQIGIDLYYKQTN